MMLSLLRNANADKVVETSGEYHAVVIAFIIDGHFALENVVAPTIDMLPLRQLFAGGD